MKTLLLSLFVCVCLRFNVNAQKYYQPSIIQPSWERDYPPFRIAGNLYYVGTEDLACYFITTPSGAVLINTGLASSARLIADHIKKLGFKLSDVKILLTTQAHFDHVGGMAEIKKLTGAKMEVEEGDAGVLADGGSSDFVFGGKGPLFAPVKADVLLHGNEVVKLGDMKINVLSHPGHTKGSCSFLFDVKDKQHTYRVLIANLPSILDETKLSGMPAYPNVGKDYAATFKAMKNIHFDLWLASHAGQFDMDKKHKPGQAYNPEAFRDQKGYDAALADLYKAYLKKLNLK